MKSVTCVSACMTATSCRVNRFRPFFRQLVQIIVNTKHLEHSCRHIEEYVHSITGVKVKSAYSAKLVSVSTFKDARSKAESQVRTGLNRI